MEPSAIIERVRSGDRNALAESLRWSAAYLNNARQVMGSGVRTLEVLPAEARALVASALSNIADVLRGMELMQEPLDPITMSYEDISRYRSYQGPRLNEAEQKKLGRTFYRAFSGQASDETPSVKAPAEDVQWTWHLSDAKRGDPQALAQIFNAITWLFLQDLSGSSLARAGLPGNLDFRLAIFISDALNEVAQFLDRQQPSAHVGQIERAFLQAFGVSRRPGGVPEYPTNPDDDFSSLAPPVMELVGELCCYGETRDRAVEIVSQDGYDDRLLRWAKESRIRCPDRKSDPTDFRRKTRVLSLRGFPWRFRPWTYFEFRRRQLRLAAWVVREEAAGKRNIEAINTVRITFPRDYLKIPVEVPQGGFDTGTVSKAYRFACSLEKNGRLGKGFELRQEILSAVPEEVMRSLSRGEVYRRPLADFVLSSSERAKWSKAEFGAAEEAHRLESLCRVWPRLKRCIDRQVNG